MYLLPGFSSRSGHISKPLLSWVHLLLNPMLGSNLYLLLCSFALPQWREVGWMGTSPMSESSPKGRHQADEGKTSPDPAFTLRHVSRMMVGSKERLRS